MWKYLTILLVVFCISNAYADSTKQMPQFDLLTTGAADDTIWVYDTSANSLYRMTTEEFILDYLSSAAGYATNNVLRADGIGGIDWMTPLSGSVFGTGVTTIDTDSGQVQSVFTGGANRIGIIGGGNATVSGSGSTITVTVYADLTSITNAEAFTGNTDFALDSAVTKEFTDRLAVSAFTGETNFITQSDGVQTTDIVYGGVSKWFVYSGTTLTGDMMAGGMLFCHAASPVVLGIPTFSASTPYFGVWDMAGSGVTIQTTNGTILYQEDGFGTAYFVNAGNSRHSAAFTCNVESGSCSYVIVIGSVGDWWNIE